ncbi:hypothetical protein PC116_g26765 [Phytophthora cactorum]|nr:hypothetical protein PC116_g26765 [Phytophthora cactorum]
MALRTRTRQGQGQTTPAGAQEAAVQFREFVLRTMIEKQCTRFYMLMKLYLPKKTINARGSKTVWIKCGNKGRSTPAKSAEK